MLEYRMLDLESLSFLIAWSFFFLFCLSYEYGISIWAFLMLLIF